MESGASSVRATAAILAFAAISVTGCSRIIRVDVSPTGPRALCGAEGIEHNQTPKGAFDILEEDPQALGTGLFLVPAPEKGALHYGVQYVTDLTYAEALRRAAYCPAFIFSPNKFMTLDTLLLKSGECGGACGGLAGKGGCPFPCLCAGICGGISLMREMGLPPGVPGDPPPRP